MALRVLRYTLKQLAKLIIVRYRPGIIGITGSVGKTSAKLAMAAVLGTNRHLRFSKGNFEAGLDLPLAIIGDFPDEELKFVSRDQPASIKRFCQALFFWPEVVFEGIKLLFRKRPDYPEILILEYAADKPGNLRKLLEICRPNISVLPAIGDVSVHGEIFSEAQEVAREKGKLIEYLPSAGFAVLNYDDETVMELKERTRAHIVTFGFERGAEIRIRNFENRTDGNRPLGVSFKLEYGGSSVPVRLDDVLGRVQGYAAAAAAAVGLIFGLNLVKISEALKNYQPAPGRMGIVSGLKSSFIIDSSSSASPLSMPAALDTLRELPAKRKIAVLGDMLELGKYSTEAHERVGRLAAQFVDVLITIGPRAKFIAEAAKKAGLTKRSIYSIDSVDDISDILVNLLKRGDLILVKGSAEIGLAKIVEELKEM